MECIYDSEKEIKIIFRENDELLVILDHGAYRMQIVEIISEEEGAPEEEEEEAPEGRRVHAYSPQDFGFNDLMSMMAEVDKIGCSLASKKYGVHRNWMQKRLQVYRTIMRLRAFKKVKEAALLEQKFEEHPMGALKLCRTYAAC